MKPRSQRMQVVLSLEERREAQAQEALAKAQQKLSGEKARLVELQNYQQDYHQQIQQRRQTTFSGTSLQQWQAFISQLDQAIAQQAGRLQVVEREVDEARRHWQSAYERRLGMERFIERCREQEQQARDKHEQKLADEATAQRFRRR